MSTEDSASIAGGVVMTGRLPTIDDAEVAECAASSRRYAAVNRYYKADEIGMTYRRAYLIVEIAELVEARTGRHVTPMFCRLVDRALRRTKRPSQTKTERFAREALKLVELNIERRTKWLADRLAGLSDDDREYVVRTLAIIRQFAPGATRLRELAAAESLTESTCREAEAKRPKLKLVAGGASHA